MLLKNNIAVGSAFAVLSQGRPSVKCSRVRVGANEVFEVQPFYWRSSNSSTLIYQCLRGDLNCIGSGASRADVRGCAPEATGPLCDACKLGSFRDPAGSCTRCVGLEGEPHHTQHTAVVVALVVGVVVVGGVVLGAIPRTRRIVKDYSEQAMRIKWQLYTPDVRVVIAILWSHFQVLGQLRYVVVDMIWPRPVEKTLDVMNALNLDLFSVAGVECSFPTFLFTDQVILQGKYCVPCTKPHTPKHQITAA